MDLIGDLTAEAVGELLPGRPVRAYPALLSTDSDALAWARAGAPAGALVVSEYQASPRGRAGREWHPKPGSSLVFSLVLRPQLPPAREGWLYAVAVSGLTDALPGETRIEWPDEVRIAGERAGAVGVQTELGPVGVDWAVVTVLVEAAAPPRAPLLARAVAAIETRAASPTTPVLADYLRRCDTIGRRVRARLIPLGPAGPQVTGKALRVLTDGALVLETDPAPTAVRPQYLALLEPV